MFLDIVGYSTLTLRDEFVALQILENYRKLIRPLIVERDVWEVKTIGDGFLVEFKSALDAILCAIEVQNSLHKINHLLGGEKTQMRAGIHVGDVIHRENDVYGDAVNIASRIESFAEPGGVCISQQAYDQVKNKIGCGLVKLPPLKKKNIENTFALYKVVLPWPGEMGVSSEFSRHNCEIPDSTRLALIPLKSISQNPLDD